MLFFSTLLFFCLCTWNMCTIMTYYELFWLSMQIPWHDRAFYISSVFPLSFYLLLLFLKLKNKPRSVVEPCQYSSASLRETFCIACILDFVYRWQRRETKLAFDSQNLSISLMTTLSFVVLEWIKKVLITPLTRNLLYEYVSTDMLVMNSISSWCCLLFLFLVHHS